MSSDYWQLVQKLNSEMIYYQQLFEPIYWIIPDILVKYWLSVCDIKSGSIDLPCLWRHYDGMTSIQLHSQKKPVWLRKYCWIVLPRTSQFCLYCSDWWPPWNEGNVIVPHGYDVITTKNCECIFHCVINKKINAYGRMFPFIFD